MLWLVAPALVCQRVLRGVDEPVMMPSRHRSCASGQSTAAVAPMLLFCTALQGVAAAAGAVGTCSGPVHAGPAGKSQAANSSTCDRLEQLHAAGICQHRC